MEKKKHNPFLDVSRRFRIPCSVEQELGFWIDRIGEGENIREKVDTLRILGLYALVCIVEGNGTFVNEVTGIENVTSGQVMIVFPDIPTSYWPESSWKTEWVVFGGTEPELWEKMNILNRQSPVIQPRSAGFQSLFAYLKETWNESGDEIFLKRREKLISVLLKQENRPDSPRIPQVNIVLEQFRQNCSLDSARIHRLEDCAIDSGFSVQYLRRKYRERYNQSLGDFVKELRMIQAKESLAAGNSIKETAIKVGIQDELYFMRIFKKFWGVTAGQFQRGLGSL